MSMNIFDRHFGKILTAFYLLLIVLGFAIGLASIGHAQTIDCLAISDKPSRVGFVWLAWTLPTGSGVPANIRIDRLNTTNGQFISLMTVPGTATEAEVPLASSGRRTYRVCAIATNGTALCNDKKGVWAGR